VSEFDEILKRLEVLETQVAALAEVQNEGRRAADLFAMVDRDVADLNTAFGTQRKLMQALRDEQVGQGNSLAEHGQALDGIIATLRVIHDTQLKQGRHLAEQGRVLARLDPAH
jgi:phage-related tail protein